MRPNWVHAIRQLDVRSVLHNKKRHHRNSPPLPWLGTGTQIKTICNSKLPSIPIVSSDQVNFQRTGTNGCPWPRCRRHAFTGALCCNLSQDHLNLGGDFLQVKRRWNWGWSRWGLLVVSHPWLVILFSLLLCGALSGGLLFWDQETDQELLWTPYGSPVRIDFMLFLCISKMCLLPPLSSLTKKNGLPRHSREIEGLRISSLWEKMSWLQTP